METVSALKDPDVDREIGVVRKRDRTDSLSD